MRLLSIVTCAGLALGAAACGEVRSETRTVRMDREPLKTVAQLDCPERADTLRRVSASATTCLYRGEQGEVELRLVALDGQDPQSLLAPIETDLQKLMPDIAADAQVDVAEEVHIVDDESGERTEVRLPGISIDAHGDKASIRMPGVVIEADNDKANVEVAGRHAESVRVNADDGGAQIRVDEGSSDSIRTSYILAQDDDMVGPNAWHAVGYEARGPAAGPIAVAVIKARGDDDAFDAARRLLRRNVGN